MPILYHKKFDIGIIFVLIFRYVLLEEHYLWQHNLVMVKWEKQNVPQMI